MENLTEQNDSLERLRRLQQGKGEIAAQAAAEERGTSPISASAMRGDRVPLTIGGVTLQLRPLKRREVREQFVPLADQWPFVLLCASAVKSPHCPGIDFESTAFLQTLNRMGEYHQSEAKRKAEAQAAGEEFAPYPLPAPVTVYDVSDDVAALSDTFDIHLPVICDTVWLMAEGTPGVAWPIPAYDEDTEERPAPPEGCTWLSDVLDELEIPDFADLLRSLKAANGRFKSDLGERFTTL